jgi:hypothetical protein
MHIRFTEKRVEYESDVEQSRFQIGCKNERSDAAGKGDITRVAASDVKIAENTSAAASRLDK